MSIIRRLGVLIAAGVLVAAFIGLGFWQLERSEQKRSRNERLERRVELPPLAPSELFTMLPEELEYRRVAAVGKYDTPREIVVTGKAFRSAAGNHVVTPFLFADGRAILIDRGWIPLASNNPPVEGVTPPSSEVRIEGVIRLSERRTRIAPKLPPEGELRKLPRVEVARLARQFPYTIAAVWLHLTTQDPGQANSLPRIVPVPKGDPGPHTSYAIQWFLFATAAVVGFTALWWRHRVRSVREPRPS